MATYYWFEGATVEALAKALTGNPGARFEVHPDETTDPPTCNLVVQPPIPPAPKPEAIVLNEAHPCPPFC